MAQSLLLVLIDESFKIPIRWVSASESLPVEGPTVSFLIFGGAAIVESSNISWWKLAWCLQHSHAKRGRLSGGLLQNAYCLHWQSVCAQRPRLVVVIDVSIQVTSDTVIQLSKRVQKKGRQKKGVEKNSVAFDHVVYQVTRFDAGMIMGNEITRLAGRKPKFSAQPPCSVTRLAERIPKSE
jgi:hypothetical protein